VPFWLFSAPFAAGFSASLAMLAAAALSSSSLAGDTY
jgi:hypothetical protein